jgi:putative tricarboxylic transport membrane protein
MFSFGFVGYFMRKYKYPLAATVIAIILGPMAEGELRRALIISGGDVSIFFTRPISAALIVMIILSVIVPYLIKRRQKTG